MIEGIINCVEIDPVKVKNRKRTIFENSEVFKNTNTFSMTKNEVQGNKMKKRPNALEKSGLAYEFPEEGELSDMKQIDILSTQILEDEQCERENDYKLNKMQCTVHEVGISVQIFLEESKNHCDKEGLSLDIVQKQGNLVESCKDTDNALSLAADDVPFDAYSAMLADKRLVLMMRVQERKAMQDNHDTKTPDSTFDCHPVAKQITEKNKKLDDELEEQAEDSLVLSEKIVEVSLAESKSKEKFLSSDVDVAKQVAISVVNGKNNQSHSVPKRPLVGRLRKKLLILDVNGLLADIVSPPPKDYKADIKIARRASET